MQLTTHRLVNGYRQWGTWLYRLATQAQRSRLREQLIAESRFPIGVLFYHRVADRCLTPWTISRRNFAAHLDWLESHFDIVSLTEAQRRIRSESNQRPTVAITFDDGYAENCDFAIPELERRGLTATYFVATESVISRAPFAHDLRINCRFAPNSIAEIQDIARAGFEIGGHTKNHVDIGKLTSRAAIQDEILGGIQALESWGVGSIKTFSFPFGMPQNISQQAVDIVLEAGISSFCSAYGAWNWPGSSGYHLRRIHADPGMQTLKSWLTLDARKLREPYALPFCEPKCSWALVGASV